MAGKTYVCLFILCVILCQVIVGVFSEDLTESNTLVRTKRTIKEQNGHKLEQRENAPFVVNIIHFPYNISIGAGAILSRHTVITTTVLIGLLDIRSIKIVAGPAYSNGGEHLGVIETHMDYGNQPHDESDGIALLTVEPAFIFNRNVNPIALHTEPLLAGTRAIVFGWGCNPSSSRGTNHRFPLQSFTVPIMRHQDCVNIYRNRRVISDKEICTYVENNRCGHIDVGAPLVVNNNLAGLYLWTGRTPGHANPDVYIIVQDIEFSQWIRNKIVHNI